MIYIYIWSYSLYLFRKQTPKWGWLCDAVTVDIDERFVLVKTMKLLMIIAKHFFRNFRFHPVHYRQWILSFIVTVKVDPMIYENDFVVFSVLIVIYQILLFSFLFYCSQHIIIIDLIIPIIIVRTIVLINVIIISMMIICMIIINVIMNIVITSFHYHITHIHSKPHD